MNGFFAIAIDRFCEFVFEYLDLFVINKILCKHANVVYSGQLKF